jgi:hypothetical protein
VKGKREARTLYGVLFMLFGVVSIGCGAGAPPPTPISFLRQVGAAAAHAAPGVADGSDAAGPAELVASAAGVYAITREFHANICGFGTYSGEATLLPTAGNPQFGFRMVTAAEGLADVEYAVTVGADGAFAAQLDAAPRFRSQISGRVQDATIEFLEEIDILDETSPCRGQTVQAKVTARKR